MSVSEVPPSLYKMAAMQAIERIRTSHIPIHILRMSQRTLPLLVRFLGRSDARQLPINYTDSLPGESVFVDDDSHDRLINILSAPTALLDAVGPLSKCIAGPCTQFKMAWLDSVRYVRAVFYWMRIPEGTYAQYPTARFAKSFILQCQPELGVLSLAYILWHISDASNYRFEENPRALAVSYVIMPTGVYAFVLYDAGLQTYYDATSKAVHHPIYAHPLLPIVSTFPPDRTDSLVMGTQHLCSLATSFLHVLT